MTVAEYVFYSFGILLFTVWLFACVGCVCVYLGDKRTRAGIVVLLIMLCSCTPNNTTPVYNIIITDNSQIVVGDDNSVKSEPMTETRTESTPIVGNKKETKNYMWIYWLIITGVVCGAGYVYYKKGKR